MPIYRLVEQPVPGGERYSAVIGPVPVVRGAARILLALALGCAAVAATSGSSPDPLLWAAALAFVASVASGWLAGAREQLVCEGHHVIHRRTGALGARRRTVRVLDLTAVRSSAGRLPLVRGIRLETANGTWIVGRHLRAADAELLVESLRRHLSLSGTVGAARRPTARDTARRRASAAVSPDEALRRRLPEG